MTNDKLSKLKVLVVDDSPINHKVVSYPLEPIFSEIISAFNGEEGFELFKTENPDVVLMDITMPVMNGIECAKAIRAYEEEKGSEKASVILAMTGSDDDDEVEMYIENGMDGCIGKPLDKELLFEKILERL